MKEKDIRIDVVSTIDGKFRAVLPVEVIPPATRPIEVTPDTSIKNRDWVGWGKYDDWPTSARKKIKKVNIAGATLRKVTAKLQGNGVVYFRPDEVREGKIRRAYIPEVEDFLANNRINTHWLPAQMSNYAYYMNCFGSFILSHDGKKIARVVHRDAELCRIKMDNKLIDKVGVIYSPYFADGGPGVQEQWAEIPYIPFDAQGSADALYRNKAKKEFAYHTYFPTPGSMYYGIPWWIALFEDKGWLEVSANVPKIILSMHANQVTLKYIIRIPESYFANRYDNWQIMTADEARVIVEEKINAINDRLTGADNVGKSIADIFQEDPVTHDGYGKIEIEAVDDKLKRDSWVPDASVSDSQIVQGFGEHPSQIGLAPEGGKLGAGSGSDQRESFNTSITLNTPDQMIILEPLNFISKFNEWGVEFYIDHTFHTTTNNQESGLISPESSKVAFN